MKKPHLLFHLASFFTFRFTRKTITLLATDFLSHPLNHPLFQTAIFTKKAEKNASTSCIY